MGHRTLGWITQGVSGFNGGDNLWVKILGGDLFEMHMEVALKKP